MATWAEQYREEGWRQGWREGWIKGWREGRQEVRQSAALKMLNLHYPISYIIEVTGLTEQEVLCLSSKQEVAPQQLAN